MPIRPIQLKGHDRPLSTVSFNNDSDLLFTTCKGGDVNVWYSENGERLGTFKHEGAVTNCSVSSDSKLLMTSSADRTVKIWNVETGELLSSKDYTAVVRACAFSAEDSYIAIIVNKSASAPSICYLCELDGYKISPLRQIVAPGADFVSVAFNALGSGVLLTDEKGQLHFYDATADTTEEGTSHVTKTYSYHTKQITSLSLSLDRSMALICSKDKTATLIDIRDDTDYKILKKYTSDRDLNACAISSLKNHILLAGGQDANEVTLTAGKEGHFELEFWHIYHCERLESVRGHFGPVNSVAFSPDGKMAVSGGEDGYVILYHFDEEYLSCTY